MQLPLILFNQPIGQRNYFDCYESALGGLLALEIKNYQFIQNIYSIIDCLALNISKNGKFYLQSKTIDINTFLINTLGFEINTSSIEEMKGFKKNFVLSFDEYYVKENSHYMKEHFYHASLGIEIINKRCFKVIDPGLQITTNDGYTAAERFINFDNEIYGDKKNITLLNLKLKSDLKIGYNNKKWQENLKRKLKEFNIDLWLNRTDILNHNQNYHYGIKAIRIFAEALLEFKNIETTANIFYKWIFPLYWKKEYLIRNSKREASQTISLLENIIKEMEMFETILLRMKTKFKSNLHNSAIKRWEEIMIKITEYVQLELERNER